jgi:hypothetical protein
MESIIHFPSHVKLSQADIWKGKNFYNIENRDCLYVYRYLLYKRSGFFIFIFFLINGFAFIYENKFWYYLCIFIKAIFRFTNRKKSTLTSLYAIFD